MTDPIHFCNLSRATELIVPWLQIFPTRTPRPVMSGSLRASSDPALAEPSWSDFDLPTGSSSLGSLSRGHQNASRPGRDVPRNATNCETPRSDNTLRRTSADFEGLKISDGGGLRTGLEDLLPELPSQRTGSSSGAVASFEKPDTPRPTSATSSRLDGPLWSGGDQTGRSSRPSVVLQAATPKQDANHETSPTAASARVPAGDTATTKTNPTENEGLDAQLPRNESVRTGHLDGSGPGPGAADLKRGRGALSVDIQQLLAGLDEEDWFMPG